MFTSADPGRAGVCASGSRIGSIGGVSGVQIRRWEISLLCEVRGANKTLECSVRVGGPTPGSLQVWGLKPRHIHLPPNFLLLDTPNVHGQRLSLSNGGLVSDLVVWLRSRLDSAAQRKQTL